MKSCLPFALSLSLLGCPSSTGPGVAGSEGGCKGEGCGHSSGGNASGGGGSTGSRSRSSNAASSSSVASSTSGSTVSGTSSATSSPGGSSSSSGSTGSASSSAGGNGQCPGTPLPDGGGCPNGSIVSQVVDLFTCAPIQGAIVQALDANAVPAAGSVTTAADGTFILCGLAGSAFTPYISETGYATTYYAEIQDGAYFSRPFVTLVSDSDLGVIGALLQGGLDTSRGSMFAEVTSGTTCGDASGWTLSLSNADGGALADGGYVTSYVGPTGFPQAGLTATTSEGVVFIYNIDLSATNYFRVSASKPDAGSCTPTVTAAFTGRVYVAADSLSAYILQLP